MATEQLGPFTVGQLRVCGGGQHCVLHALDGGLQSTCVGHCCVTIQNSIPVTPPRTPCPCSLLNSEMVTFFKDSFVLEVFFFIIVVSLLVSNKDIRGDCSFPAVCLLDAACLESSGNDGTLRNVLRMAFSGSRLHWFVSTLVRVLTNQGALVWSAFLVRIFPGSCPHEPEIAFAPGA